MESVIRLQGKSSFNGVPYVINIHANEEKVITIVMSGKPCKTVKDHVMNFKNSQANAENVSNMITLAMMNHNEFVSKTRL